MVTGKRDYVFKSSQEGKDFPASNLSISLPMTRMFLSWKDFPTLHVMLSDVLPGGSLRFSEATYFSFVFFENKRIDVPLKKSRLRRWSLFFWCKLSGQVDSMYGL